MCKNEETVDKFLDLLAKDIEENPNRLQPVTQELWQQVQDLVGDLEIDLEEPIQFDEDWDDWDDTYDCGCCTCCGCFCDEPTDRFGNPKEGWENYTEEEE